MRVKLLTLIFVLAPLLQSCTAKKGALPALSGAAAKVDAANTTIEVTTDIVADLNSAAVVTITLKDKDGNAVEGVPPSLAVSGSGNQVAQCSVSDELGISTCEVKSSKAESKTVTMTFPTEVSGPSILFVAGPPTKLGFSVQPGGGVAGTSWTNQPVVQVQDQYGNLIADANDSITISLSTGSGTLSGTLSASAVNGEASFSGLSLELIGSDKVLTATAAGLSPALSAPFVIQPAANSSIVIVTQPGGGGAGEAWATQPVIEFRDQFGNRTNSTAQVTAALTAGTGTLAGTATISAVAGQATFSGLSIATIGTGKQLTFSTAGLTNVVSSSFSITHGSASQLVFTTQPSGGNAGSVWAAQPVIEIRDSLGNLVNSGSSSTQSVSLSVAGGGSLVGTTSVNAVGGVATFSGLSMTSAGSKVITASLGTIVRASNAFNINVGSASKLAFTVQPGGGVSGASWTQQPIVVVRDAHDNLVTSGSYNVSVAITSGTGALSGGTTLATSSGVATYFNLSANLVGNNKIITASAAGLTSAVSNSFTITAGSPAQLAFTTQPGGGASASVWSQQPVVEIRDSAGNPISTATNAVTVALTTGTGNLSGTLTVNAIAGVATFSNLTMDLVGANKVITASAAGLTSAASNAFAITAGIPQASSTVQTSPSSVFADGTTTSTVTVTLVDAYSNPVSGKSVTLVSSRGGTDTIIGSPATTNASGVATFTIRSSTTGTSTLTASIPSDSLTLTATPTVTFKSFVASAAQSEWSLAPVSQIANGVATSTITVTIKNSAGEALPGKSVTLSSSRGVTDTIVGSPATTNSSGIASFTIRSSTTGEPTLTVSVPSDAINITTAAYMTFLAVAPYADWQARLANSSSSYMSQGINSPATNIWKDLFNLGPNDGTLNNFGFNTTSSGWMGSGSGTVTSGTTGAFRLGFDGTDDYVDFGNGLNSTLTNFSFESWFRANSSTSSGKVIFGNGDNSGKGFVVRQSWTGNSFLEFTIGGERSYVGEVIADSPTAYYRTEEASGTTAAAAVGVNGTYSGTITYSQASGFVDNSRTVRFNGTNAFINIGNNYNPTANFTVEAWVHPLAVGARRDFVSKEGTNNGFWLGMETTSRVSFNVGNGTTNHKVTSTTALAINTWYHIVGVRDSAAGLLRIYVNGVQEATTAFTGSPATNTANLNIANSPAAGGRFFNGRVDEVAIYQNNALSATRINKHYSARLIPTCHTTSAINNTSWHHLAGTFNDSTKAMTLFLNGTSHCSITAAGYSYSGSLYPFSMGAQLDDLSNPIAGTYWNGAIGDLRIYNSVLSGANITTNRTATSARFP